MAIQTEELKSFLAEAATSSWKGPGSMTCDRADRNTQIHGAKDYAAEFANKKARQEAIEENNNFQVFVPGSGAWHRPSTKKSIEGSSVSKNKSKKERVKVCRKFPCRFGETAMR